MAMALGSAWDTLQQRWFYFGLAVLSGIAYFLGFCGHEQWPLSWMCLAPVLWAVADPTLNGRQAFFISWIFGWVTHLGGYPWIVHLLKNFAHLPVAAAILGYLLLCAAQGAQLAVWGYGVHQLHARWNVPVRWAAPVLLVLVEWAYPLLFPSYLSNSQYRVLHLIQILDLVGPLGISGILALSSAALYEAIAFRRRRIPNWHRGLITLALLVGASLAYGHGAIADADDDVLTAEKRLRIGLVQANMGIWEKHKNPAEGLRRHRAGSLELERQNVELLVWPESAYTYTIGPGVSSVDRRMHDPLKTPVLFGALRLEKGPPRDRTYNSAFLANADGKLLGHYDKHVLLAFGEYVPLTETFPSLWKLFPEGDNFARGESFAPLVMSGIKLGVLICFEDVLPGFVRQIMREEPHILVNLTNDAWFGDGLEPRIHLALSTFRAVESRRFLVRSTNTGVSAFVDPVGRILSETQTFARANLVHDVPILTGTTFYTRVGDWIAWLCLAIFLLWARPTVVSNIAQRRRHQNGGSTS